MEKRFRALRAIGTVLKILAWVVLVFGILGGLFMLLAGVAGGLSGSYGPSPALPTSLGIGGILGGLVGGIGVVIGAVLNFLFLYAAGDAIYLALAIEENTREAALYLKGGDALPRQP